MSTSDILAAAPSALRAVAAAVPGVTDGSEDALAAARRLHALLGAALRDADAASSSAVAAPVTPPAAEASLLAAITASAEAAARAALDDAAGSPPSVDAATLPAACREPSAHMYAAAICWSVAYANEASRLRAAGAAGASPAAPATPSSSLQPHLRLRYATAADAPVVLGFIRELAEFEREPEAVVTSEATFTADGLTPAGLADVAAFDAVAPLFHVIIAEVPADVAAAVAAEDAAAAAEAGGGGGATAAPAASSSTGWVPVAMAFAHPSYSTWEGRTLYLEDLYVSPAYRRRGVSKALFTALARAAAVAGCARLQWSVLTWNAAAVQAYDAMPAARLEDWRLYRLYADGLARVGGLEVVVRRERGAV